MYFKRFPNNVVAFHVRAAGDANTGTGARPALQQSFEFQAQKGFGNGQKAHAELIGHAPPRDDLTYGDFAPENALPDNRVGFPREAGRLRSCFLRKCFYPSLMLA